MKKIILTLSAVFFISANAMAFNIYIDAFGTYVGNESAENQFGGGAALFFGINKNFSVGITFSQSSFIPIVKEEVGKIYSDMKFNGGLEYNFQIADLPLFWTSYLGLGFESLYIYKPSMYSGPNNMGGFGTMAFSFEILTGIRWDFHPHIALFGKVGFHLPYITSEPLKDWTIYGLVGQIGIRFAFWNNKPIDEQY